MKFPEPPHRTFNNLKKADRDSFPRDVEESLALLELSFFCSTGEPQFRKILNFFAKHHISQGHILNMTPNLTEITKRLINERDALSSSSPNDPHTQIQRTASRRIQYTEMDPNLRVFPLSFYFLPQSSC